MPNHFASLQVCDKSLNPFILKKYDEKKIECFSRKSIQL